MKTFEQGDTIKFLGPKANKKRPDMIGHGPQPGGVSVAHNGEQVFLKYGTIYQVSENTAAEVANLDNSPLPLIKAAWLNASPLNKQFKKIETND